MQQMPELSQRAINELKAAIEAQRDVIADLQRDAAMGTGHRLAEGVAEDALARLKKAADDVIRLVQPIRM